MAERDFDSLFADKKYRALKVEERRVFDLLIEAGEKMKLYQELVREYQEGLNKVAADVSGMESELSISPDEIDKKLGNLQEKVNEQNAAIRMVREDLRRSKLRFLLGEYDEQEYSIRREKYREKLLIMVEDREWVETGMALVRRVKSNSEKIAHDERLKGTFDSDQKAENASVDAQASGQPEPSKSGDKGANSFSMDETAPLAQDLIGSDPERLLIPALHIKSVSGWERYPLKKREISIGNIRNPENDIALYDPQVSRRHAKIIQDAVTEEWYFVDGGSTNGSMVNDSAADAKNPLKLSNRDVIMLGDTRIVLYLP